MNAKPVYLSVRQTAENFPLSPRIIHHFIEQNILPAYRVPARHTIRIKREDLEALLEPVNASAQERSRLEAI